MASLDVIREAEGYRLVRNGSEPEAYAVVEVRAGRVYSLHGGERREAEDSGEGMAQVVGADGWTDRQTAEQHFAEMINGERRFAERLW